MIIIVINNNNSNDNNIKLNKIINNKVKTRLSTTCNNFDSPTHTIARCFTGAWSLVNTYTDRCPLGEILL